MPTFAIPLVILTWSRMLQEYFSKDSENTFFGLEDYSKQKKKNTAAPYDNMFFSGNDFEEFKVDSFSCFQSHETLERSPDVCPSLLQWAEYLLTSAIETENKKIERLQKLRKKPMVRCNMTHTTMKSRQPRDKTVEVVDASTPEASTNEITTAVGVMPEEVDMNSEAQAKDARAEATTSSNASADEEPTTNNTPSILLLYRIGEALQAAKRTHDSMKRKSPNRKGPD
jgi:hypothetical protein